MNRKLKVMVEAIAEVLDEYDLKGRIIIGKRHPKMEVAYLGETFCYTFAGTTGDNRAVLNVKAGIRRILRDIEKRKCA